MSVFVESHNIISSLGFSSSENFSNVLEGNSGIKEQMNEVLSPVPLMASIIDEQKLKEEYQNIGNISGYTRFEQMAILSISKALKSSEVDPTSSRTLFLLATTKGNIELLENPGKFQPKRLYLWHTAKVIADFFSFVNTPIVISNACISGVSAMVFAKRLIDAGQYDHVVVTGADTLSKFVVSGFQSFQSLSAQLCKPFDAQRDGLNLGEAAATVIITREPTQPAENLTEIVRGAMHNDANHISGPSRTGEGLYLAITDAVKNDEVDFISAHGTATPYNDNMESIAISRAKLNQVPVNSIKAFFGHTLGAAGVLETIIAIESMKSGTIIKTLGFNEYGVSEKVNVATSNYDKNMSSILKLASGFGGCNAALLMKKV